MIFSLSGILAKAEAEKNLEAKVNVLRTFDNPVLRRLMRLTFDPSIKWLLPSGDITYTPNKLVDNEHALYNASKKLDIWIDGAYPQQVTDEKRVKLFRLLLETLAYEDAELLLSIKDKKLPYKSLTKVIIKKAFPGIFEDEQVAQKV